MSLIQDKAVFVTADGINKTLKQAITDGDIGGGGVASVNGQTGIVSLNTDNIPEDPMALNLYHTTFRAQSAVLPSGGASGQVLAKASAVDYDVQWTNASGGGGSGSVEIFNDVFGTRGSASSLTGLAHFRVPSAMTISSVRVTVFEKNGVSSGSLTVDVKVNSSPDDVGMTTIFSAAPTLNFATAADYDSNIGTLSTSALSAGQWLRIDATSIPANWVGYFHVEAFTA